MRQPPQFKLLPFRLAGTAGHVDRNYIEGIKFKKQSPSLQIKLFDSNAWNDIYWLGFSEQGYTTVSLSFSGMGVYRITQFFKDSLIVLIILGFNFLQANDVGLGLIQPFGKSLF